MSGPDDDPDVTTAGETRWQPRVAKPSGWRGVALVIASWFVVAGVAVAGLAARAWRSAVRNWPALRDAVVRASGSAARGIAAAAVGLAAWTRRNWPIVRRHTVRAARATARAADAAARVTARAVRAAALAVAAWARRNWPTVRHHTARAARGTARTTGVAAATSAAAVARWSRRNGPVIRRGAAQAGRVTGRATVRLARGTARGSVRAASAGARPLAARRHGRSEPAGHATRHRPALRLPGNPLLRLVSGCAAIALAMVVLVAPVSVVAPVAIRAVSGAVDGANQSLDLPDMAQRSVVYAADGSVLAVLHGDENRKSVPLDQISPALINAVVDTEDADFWRHGGVSGKSVVRALKANVSAGSIQQGGSTITRQLVKNTLLTPKQTVDRKVKEMVLADRLEKQLGKKGVLERYLNTVYFGEGAYGVEAAAETYFGIAASHLDVPQAALLAGLIQQPDGYDPIKNPEAATNRRREVLDLMVEHGHVSPTDATVAAGAPLPTSALRPPDGSDYFTDAVKQELLADKRLGATPEERAHTLFGGGLAIHTTLDPRQQAAASATVAAGIPNDGHHITAALAAVDPADGSVRAVVGGPDFGVSQFNAELAGAGRQPGSSFKVFTLVTALQQGYSPNDTIDGATPCAVPNPGGTPDPWLPGNFEGEDFGWLNLTDATAHSVNCAYARLALHVGLDKVAETAHQMGVTNKLDVVPSMVLGTNDVTPLQMASAYATLAADGMYHRPHLISEVDGRDGKPVFRFEDEARRVMPEQIARETTQVLQQVVQKGTGRAAAVNGRDVAGKTGTAENYQDAWFVGYTPQLATAVWMGDPSGEVPMRGVQGIDVQGGSFPARIWSAFMTQALAPLPAVPFTGPDPSKIPGGVMLQDGRPRTGSAAAPATPGTPSPGKTWCWTSCGKPGVPPPGYPGTGTTAPPAPAPGGGDKPGHGKKG